MEINDILISHGLRPLYFPMIEQINVASKIVIDCDFAGVVTAYRALLCDKRPVKINGVVVNDEEFKANLESFYAKEVNRYIDEWKLEEYILGVHPKKSYTPHDLEFLAEVAKVVQGWSKEIMSNGEFARFVMNMVQRYSHFDDDGVSEIETTAAVYDILADFGFYPQSLSRNSKEKYDLLKHYFSHKS